MRKILVHYFKIRASYVHSAPLKKQGKNKKRVTHADHLPESISIITKVQQMAFHVFCIILDGGEFSVL